MPLNQAVALPEMLAQVACEFGALAGEVEQLQDTISDLLSSATVSPELLQQAQALDHVFQHMTELGQILARVGREASPTWQINAHSVLAEVSLSALAHRLAGLVPSPAVAGEMEMF